METLGLENNAIAIDVGGTSTRCAIVNPRNEILEIHRIPTDRTDIDKTLADLLDGLLVNQIKSNLIPSLGISLPEFVKSGVPTSSIVVNWNENSVQKIESKLSEFFGIQLIGRIESDVRCGAIAEFQARNEFQASSLLYFSWGTGTATSLVLPDSNCWEGERGEAIAVGEWLVENKGKLKKFETFASGLGITTEYQLLTNTNVSAIDIVTLAEQCDEKAKMCIETAATAAGNVLANLANILDPAVIVLGGGIGASDSLLTQIAIRTYLARSDDRGWPHIQRASFERNSSLIGAAIIGRKRNSKS